MTAEELTHHWQTDPRWHGIRRPYKGDDVVRLRGSIQIEYTLARLGAQRLWDLLHSESYIPALGTLTGHQAVEQIQAGLKAIYVSGWQVAADGNLAGQMYPDQSIYPSNSVPAVVRGINAALTRADQIQTREGANDLNTNDLNPNDLNPADLHWFAPIIADAEAGFGGPVNAFELMKWMIEAGAAGVHFEDQPVAKRSGHGSVVAPVKDCIEKLVAARLAADVCAVPTLLIARTDSASAKFLDGQGDERDAPFLTGERNADGYFGFRGGVDAAIARACACAPYADLLWCETSKPDLAEARKFAEGVHHEFPGKMLAYNLSPSFNWKRKFAEPVIANFQRDLAAMGYKFQFITLGGYHALNHSMFMLAKEYATNGMAAYAHLQEQEFQSAKAHRFTALKHQRFVGNGYFDDVMKTIARGLSPASNENPEDAE